jgi:hypothetical protein
MDGLRNTSLGQQDVLCFEKKNQKTFALALGHLSRRRLSERGTKQTKVC